MSLSTHVLDTTTGRPAAGMAVAHEHRGDEGWVGLGRGRTDADGRIGDLVPGDLPVGEHRVVFAVGEWFGDAPTWWTDVTIAFVVTAPADHVHVPLLLSPYGYTTYRGS